MSHSTRLKAKLTAPITALLIITLLPSLVSPAHAAEAEPAERVEWRVKADTEAKIARLETEKAKANLFTGIGVAGVGASVAGLAAAVVIGKRTRSGATEFLSAIGGAGSVALGVGGAILTGVATNDAFTVAGEIAAQRAFMRSMTESRKQSGARTKTLSEELLAEDAPAASASAGEASAAVAK